MQLGQLQAQESQYQTQTNALQQQEQGLSQQRQQVSSDVSGLNQQIGLFNAQESTYLSGVASFNATYGGKQLNPAQFSAAQGEQKALSSQYASLFQEQLQLQTQGQKVGQEVNAYNFEAIETNQQGLTLNAQGASLSRQAGLLGIQATGLNAEITQANSQTQTQKPVKGPSGIFGDIEIGAADIYGAFSTGAKDVITGAGVAGRETGSLISTGKFEPINQATAQYLNESVYGLPSGNVTAQVGSGLLSYSTPGVAIIKGVGEYNSSPYQRAFDIGVGALSIAPFVGEAAGVSIAAGSTGGRLIATLGNPFVRTGLGAGLSATGAAVSGGNLEQIGEAGLIGGGISYFGGEFAQGVGGKINAAAAQGQEALNLQEIGLVRIGTEQGADVLGTPEQAQQLGLEVGQPSIASPGRAPYVSGTNTVAIGSETENVYASTEQAQNLGINPGPTFGQKIALGFTGGFNAQPLPVGGAETTTIENDTGIGTITEELVGAQPVNLQDYVQDFEGFKPTQNIPTGGEPQPTADQIAFQQSPFTSSIGKAPSTPFEYGPETTSPGKINTGPSGRGSGGLPGGFSNPGRGGQTSFTINAYPPGVIAPGFRTGALSFEPSTSSGYSSDAFARGFPEVSSLSTFQTPPMGTGFSVQSLQTQQQSSSQKQNAFPITSQISATQQDFQQEPSQIQLVQQAQVSQQQTSQVELLSEAFAFSPVPTGFGPTENGPYPFHGLSLRTPVPERRQSSSKKNAYGFGVNKNPVGNLLTLGTKRHDYDL